MAIGERIKKVRKALGLTQQEFADKIGSKRNTIATYEMGRTEPSAAVVSLVCTKFNVSETWLRTGNGEEMFIPSPEESVDELIRTHGLDDLSRQIIMEFIKLKPEEREAVIKFTRNFAQRIGPAAPTSTPAPAQMAGEGPEIDAEMEAYRQRRIEEKKQELQTSAAKEHGAG